VLFGAAVGGVGAGLLWTAQGAYFKINANRYAKATGLSDEKANGKFSSTFAACYLGFEVLLKVAGSLIAKYGAEGLADAIYVLYTAVVVGTTVAMHAGAQEMVPLEPDADEAAAAASAAASSLNLAAKPPSPGCTKVTAALRLLCTNPKCALMAPTNVAFGLAAAFITQYVQGSVVAPLHPHDDDTVDDVVHADYHNSQVLLYSSVAVGVAALLALPGFGFHWLRERCGTQVVMAIGATCFCAVALFSALLDDVTLRHLLPLLYVVYGAGRRCVLMMTTLGIRVYARILSFTFHIIFHIASTVCQRMMYLLRVVWILFVNSVWEATVKAIFADFFTEAESMAAFANIILQSGIASTLAFFLFPGFSAGVKNALLFIASALGFVCYFMADRIHAREKARDINESYAALDSSA